MEHEEKQLTPTEWHLMECLWEKSPRTGREAVEYMKDNIKNLSFNLDKVINENNELAYQQVFSRSSMCEKYNEIVNDSVYCAHLDYYKEHFVNANNHDYDAFEDNEHDDVGDDAI